ncbi:rod shape-determining protein MreC [Candidatus Berkelbacteria bacterium]|nr:rod shape-determining protein MreC [Candidatus Berkelbacteria bacterium]
MKFSWKTGIVLLFVISLSWLIIDTANIFRQLSLSNSRAESPLFLNVRKIKSFFDTLHEALGLREQVNKLEAENSELKAQIIQVNNKLQQIKMVKQNLDLVTGLDLDQDHDLEVARIIGRAPLRFTNGVIINIGAESGIEPDQVVLANGFLVGLIESVASHSSQVTLITDIRLKIPVILQKSRAQGLLNGALEGLTLSDIGVDQEVESDEPVLSSALADFVPPDIPIGFVGEELSSESEVLQKFRVDSPIDFDQLEYVLVWKK